MLLQFILRSNILYHNLDKTHACVCCFRIFVLWRKRFSIEYPPKKKMFWIIQNHRFYKLINHFQDNSNFLWSQDYKVLLMIMSKKYWEGFTPRMKSEKSRSLLMFGTDVKNILFPIGRQTTSSLNITQFCNDSFCIISHIHDMNLIH